ncbi:unnamed protein product [Rhizophagus irregularis]|uniref:Uncharacterized protein n=1 Tax=Rhizophagus irregularis TaxID=588596 RepID=A0A916E808_9GLOM|nr:unnamed protein product [Rhizophagus irregularis]
MKIDISDIKEHKEEIEKTPSETKDDIFVKTEMHRKSIHQIFVSQCMDYTEYGSDDYVVTYRLIDLNNDRTSSDRFLKLKHQVDYATMAWDSFLIVI